MDGADGRERRCRSSGVLPSHLSHTVIHELFDSKGSYTRAATAVDDTLTPCSNHGDADNLRCLLDDILERRRVSIFWLLLRLLLRLLLASCGHARRINGNLLLATRFE